MPSSSGSNGTTLIDVRASEVASRSDVGRSRTKNEDACTAYERPDGARLLVVADGMGGHRGGATASRLAVEAIGAAFESATSTTGERTSPFSSEWLREAIRSANRKIHAASKSDRTLRGMGTTVVSLLIDVDGRAFVSHVGDSRAYRLRGDELERITEDHSVVGEMQRRGMLTEDEAARHPRRNEILRSVGFGGEVDPETRELELLPGDSLILCSDGLCGVLSDNEIYSAMQNAIAASGADSEGRGEVERIVDEWISRANDAGGPDNITVQLLRIPTEPLSAGADSAKAARASGSFAAIGMLAALVAGVVAFAWILWN